MNSANDNFFIIVERRKKPLPLIWHTFEKVIQTAFGPVGVSGGEFVYLDAETAMERS